MTKDVWWWPEIADEDYFNSLRETNLGLENFSNSELEEQFGVSEGCFFDAWDHLADAREHYQEIAKFSVAARSALEAIESNSDDAIDLVKKALSLISETT